MELGLLYKYWDPKPGDPQTADKMQEIVVVEMMEALNRPPGPMDRPVLENDRSCEGAKPLVESG